MTPAPQMIARLKIVSGMLIGKVYEAGLGVWTVGGDAADINLRDPRVQSRHAELDITEEVIRIKDLETGDPVLVNEKKTKSCVIDHGDTIRIGRTEFRVEPLAGLKDSLTVMLQKAGVQVESKK